MPGPAHSRASCNSVELTVASEPLHTGCAGPLSASSRTRPGECVRFCTQESVKLHMRRSHLRLCGIESAHLKYKLCKLLFGAQNNCLPEATGKHLSLNFHFSSGKNDSTKTQT